ncbi:MAG: hypothetical protein A2Z02_01185 [Chloroflexi bacterium RBG_16_48_7]|nr:MAG: hypothetical protein A2Z02_01185 [Chloroflexi bacterium RBG_16_48_7]
MYYYHLYRDTGIPIYNILEGVTPQKPKSAPFDRPLDLAVVFHSSSGSKARFSYGELTVEKIFEVSKLLSCGDYWNGFRKHTCPDCDADRIESAVFSYFAGSEWRTLWKTHLLVGGYFRMKRGP